MLIFLPVNITYSRSPYQKTSSAESHPILFPFWVHTKLRLPSTWLILVNGLREEMMKHLIVGVRPFGTLSKDSATKETSSFRWCSCKMEKLYSQGPHVEDTLPNYVSHVSKNEKLLSVSWDLGVLLLPIIIKNPENQKNIGSGFRRFGWHPT